MPWGLNITSEIGRLRKVMVHRPGGELLNLSPDNLAPLLFDDIPYLEVAQREHDAFVSMLREEGVEVLYMDDLVAEALDAREGLRDELTSAYLAESGVDGFAFREAVRERLDAIGPTVDFVHKLVEGVRSDEVDLAPTRSMSLADRMLTGSNISSDLLIDPMPNVYFTRDTFSVIGGGVSVNSMRFPTRRRETLLSTFLFRAHPEYAGVPQWYDRDLPHSLEGGDILVLGNGCVAVGISERTSAAGIDGLAHMLLWGANESGFDRVYAFSIPHKRSFMHLDTVFTQVDVDTFTVHPGILTTLRVFELRRGEKRGEVRISQMDGSLEQILCRIMGLPAVRLIKCGGDDPIASAREQWNDGSNTLAVAPGRVFVYQRNSVTNEILYREGIDLLEIPSAELSRGRGGPHCMSMAFWRDPVA